MKSFLLRTALPVAGGIAALLLLPRISSLVGPEIPPVPTLAPTTSAPTAATPATTPPQLPEGFPSMLLPPPKVEVAPGQPQPIATRYGLTYAIPADWTNKHQMSAGWSGEDGHAAYGIVGFFGYGFCPTEEGGWLAISGASGAQDPDLEAVALDKVRAVEWIFDDNAGALPTVEYGEPVWFEIAGRPAVRISASVSDIPKIGACEPEAAQFDIVATFEELPLELELRPLPSLG